MNQRTRFVIASASAVGLLALCGLFGLMVGYLFSAASASPAWHPQTSDTKIAPPDGLEPWVKTGQISLPARAKAFALAIGPRGLMVLGEKSLWLYAAPNRSQPGQGVAWLTENLQLSFSATAMAIASDGTIFIAGDNRIHRFSLDLRSDGDWEFDRQAFPIISLSVDGDRLWAASPGLRTVLAFDRDGQAQGRLEPLPGQEFIIPSPHFCVIAHNGGVVATNPGRHGLQVFSRLGQQISSWFSPGGDWEGFQGCCNPIAIANLSLPGQPDLIVCAEKGAPRVKIVDFAGRLRAALEQPTDFLPGTQDIALAVDAMGKVYVLDGRKQEIRIHERKRGQ